MSLHGDEKVVSPSRTYAVMCNKLNFDGYYFKKVVLPESIENNASNAVWYFLNYCDMTSCAVCAIPVEDYSNLTAVIDIHNEEIKNARQEEYVS